MATKSTPKAKQLKERQSHLDVIRDRMYRVEVAKNRRKTATEMLNEHIEQLELYKQLQTAKQAVEAAREKLYQYLGSDSDYISLREGVDSANQELSVEQESLSAEVLDYRDRYETRAVEVDEEHERPIIVSAKLGRKREIQLELDLDGKHEQEELL